MSHSVFLPSTDVQNLKGPAVHEFLDHPDFRQISAFFLGWVFLSSIRYVIYSPFFWTQIGRCGKLFMSLRCYRRSIPKDNAEGLERAAIPADDKERGQAWTGNDVDSIERLRREESDTLTFLLALSFGIASLSDFFSLLAFGPGQASETTCVFVIAFGDIASQGGRVIGLLLLNLELRRHHIARWESWAFWASLIIVTSLMFGTIAAGVGSTDPVPQLQISLCYKIPFLPTSLPSSLISIALEIYLVIRFISLTHHFGFNSRDLEDARVHKAVALLLLDLLVVVPNSAKTDILTEFIPFSIGAVLVLAAFNVKHETRRRVPVSMDVPIMSAYIDIRPFPTPTFDSPTRPPRSIYISGQPYPVQTLFDDGSEDRLGLTPSTSVVTRSSRCLDEDSAQTAIIQPVVQKPIPSYVPALTVRNSGPEDHTPLPSLEKVSSKYLQRKIMPSQAQFAESLEKCSPQEGLRVRSRPRIVVNTQPSNFEVPSPAGDTATPPTGSNAPHSATSPGSTVFGSDIIRLGSRGKDRMKKRSPPSAQSHSAYSRRVSYMSSPDRSLRYQSWATGPAPPDSLPVVYEINDGQRIPLTPTLGQTVLSAPEFSPTEVSSPVTPPPRYMHGLPSSPRLHTAFRIDGTGLVRGPRPLPQPTSSRNPLYMRPEGATDGVAS
ncbi:hypothetical protein EW146_g4991 [Bondarzewia mesenterica]|uniref:Uncharacterized protein n=1 Tax=Bondarzewia mesenterica TaxID=1095465 RepID=A0A4S4LSV1_9AGAM|nr:hypothetical protein EW146_g4991 [Bondarzewia mesenterica]